jgi:hypothetical protein
MPGFFPATLTGLALMGAVESAIDEAKTALLQTIIDYQGSACPLIIFSRKIKVCGPRDRALFFSSVKSMS